MQLSQQQKTFSEFFFFFLNIYEYLNIFEKRMSIIADVFLKLRAAKKVGR